MVKYELLEIEVIIFDSEDVVTSSILNHTMTPEIEVSGETNG